MKSLSFLAISILMLINYYPVLAAQSPLFDPNLHIDVTHPSVVPQDSKFTISTVLKAKTSNLVNITMYLKPAMVFNIIGDDSVSVPELKQDSTQGYTFELETGKDVTEGEYSVNFELNYEHKEILGDYSQQSFSKAISIQVRNMPEIVSSIKAPNALFAGDKFPVSVELRNTGLLAKNVVVTILPPDDLTLVGQNTHAISRLDAGEKFAFDFELKVSDEIEEATKKQLQLKTSYVDDTNNSHESTEKFTLFVRPRGFLEIGAASGFWLGPVFISFITGIGSIVSAAVGFLILVYRIKQKKVKTSKREKMK